MTGRTKQALQSEVPIPSDEELERVRELERKTGIDFFCNLPDAVEERVETMTTASIIDAWGL